MENTNQQESETMKPIDTISWTAPADAPGIGGRTFTDGVATSVAGNAMVDFGHHTIQGKRRRLMVRVEGKADLAAAVDRAKAADAATREKAAANLATNVPGLDALRAARIADEEYSGAFRRMMDDGNNDGANAPQKPATSAEAIARQYPRAALYVQAEGYQRASHWAKSKAGGEAMEIVANGGSLEEAAARLENWLTDNDIEVD